MSSFHKFFLELEPVFVSISILETVSSMYLSFKKYEFKKSAKFCQNEIPFTIFEGKIALSFLQI